MAVHTLDALPTPATRTVVVIDRALPKGLAANAAAVLALTLGARRPALVGPDFHDGAGEHHPGLFPAGLPVLGADAAELPAIRAAAHARGLLVADLPAFGQQTNDYEAFRAAVREAEQLAYLGLVVCGPPKPVRAVTGSLALLR
jgi:hypothetical protein